jgi:hypothetical protein
MGMVCNGAISSSCRSSALAALCASSLLIGICPSKAAAVQTGLRPTALASSRHCNLPVCGAIARASSLRFPPCGRSQSRGRSRETARRRCLDSSCDGGGPQPELRGRFVVPRQAKPPLQLGTPPVAGKMQERDQRNAAAGVGCLPRGNGVAQRGESRNLALAARRNFVTTQSVYDKFVRLAGLKRHDRCS